MADPWAEFADAPIVPATRASAKPKAGEWDEFDDAPAPVQRAERARIAGTLRATGQVHDGDTFAVEGGGNARLYGVDAFELNQTGTTRRGVLAPLGRQARGVLAPFATPDATVTPTGALTYGRPVASLDNGGDAGEAVLRQGYGIATPEYLKADPARLGDYMEAERDARLNRRGAWSTSFEQPSSYRHGTPDPWNPAVDAKPGEKGTAVFWDEPLPAQGLRPEIAEKWLALHKAPGTTADDILGFAKANGFGVDPKSVARFIRERDARPGAPINDELQYRALPRVLTDHKDGATGAALRGFADPINILDEAGAIADTLLPGTDRENLWNSDRRFGDVYANNLDQNRSILAYDDANHPYARFSGQLASGVLLPGGSVEGVGFGAARAALRGGAGRYAAEQAARTAVVRRLGIAGAAEGGLAGVGQGEDWQGRATGGLIGTMVGAGLGTLTGYAAPEIARLVGRPFNKLAGREGERVAGDFTDGAIDTARARASNDAAGVSDGLPASATTQAMVNETGLPSISSPRLTDDPAVTGRATPLLDPVNDDLRRAQAADLRSGDVLPVPNNTVASMDEAEAIAAGRLAPVRAPNEAEELTRRTIPNANTGAPIVKRGPLDLVSWLRSEGGVRAQGGELERYGIDNAGRKGVDFAGGEQRLGPLVANEGMTYDQAAERAWEAGFFPDHAERPTVAEFLETLADTHSGRQRAFLPDDLAEVDAFEAARRQRFEVEDARAAGSPLVEDRSVPAGYDDLDRNSPPVEAYEEWGENAPDFAGNIRLDKLDSPQSIARALVHTEARAGGFDAATRGRITQAETKNLAADLGMTADDLLKRRKGQAFNAEEALASRQILARSATDLVNMAKRMARVDNPGDEMEATFRESWLRHAAIQEQVAGMTAEAGRLLQQFRMTADGRDAQRALSVLGEGLGGVGRAWEVAERIVDLERVGTSPAGINQFALRSLLPRWKDKGVELYINSLLSGPQTHAVNILSNTLTALGQLPEHAVAVGVGAVRRALPGQRETERVLFSELGSRGVGMLIGAKEGARAAARSFLTGDAVDGITKVETQQANAIGGKVGSFIRTPTRLLTAEDEFFKGVARRMELAGLATRQAREEGLSGAAARERAGDLMMNPSEAMLTKAQDYSRYLTFQTPLDYSSLAAKLSQSAQQKPLLKLLVPFVRTPMNLLKFAAERSPAAVLMKSWRKEVVAGGVRRDLALARAMVGTGFGAVMYEAALDGRITGGGPADGEACRLLQADGWQPYSFKVGDEYYSYARLDPFSTTIGTVADLVDLQSHMTDKQQEQSLTLVLAAMVNNLSSKTWLSGVSTAVEAISDPERNLQNFLSRTAGAIVVPAFVAQMARSNDPIMREARGVLDRIKSRIPGYSEELPARLDAFGRPIVSEGGVGPDIISPLWTGTAKNDPTIAALLDADAHVTAPRRKIGGRDLTPGEYERYAGEVGRIGKPALDALVLSPEWKAMDQDGKQDAVRDVMKDARASAKSVIDESVANGATDPWAEFQDAPASSR